MMLRVGVSLEENFQTLPAICDFDECLPSEFYLLLPDKLRAEPFIESPSGVQGQNPNGHGTKTANSQVTRELPDKLCSQSLALSFVEQINSVDFAVATELPSPLFAARNEPSNFVTGVTSHKRYR